MFSFFKSAPKAPELSGEQIAYLENQFHWLLETFGDAPLRKKILVPDHNDFPIVFDGSDQSLRRLLHIICQQMDIDSSTVAIERFARRNKQINAGLQDFYLPHAASSSDAAGYYWGKDEQNRFLVSLEESIIRDPENVTGVLAHELGHLLLLGQHYLDARFDKDHELVTEVLTVFFGLGIFRANRAFRFRQGFDGWSWQKSGYLRQQTWAYLLALYAYYRNEKKPEWAKYLNPTLRKDLQRSLAWLEETDAGVKFISGHWKNLNQSMATINLNGKWLKQSVYGALYQDEFAGKTMLTEITLTDEEGHLSGTGRDLSGTGIQDAPISISGQLRENAVQFELTYQFGDQKKEDGIVIRKAQKESYSVFYNGYYSPFLDIMTGRWEIRKKNSEGRLMSYGSGSWEMKRG